MQDTAPVIEAKKISNLQDIYDFQSESNRVKGYARPVTIIAMNIALKESIGDIAKKHHHEKWPSDNGLGR